MGYLQQELDLPQRPSLRLLPAFAAGLGGNIDEHAEALLRLGLFRTSEFHVPVGSLSAGQQRRLALARLLLGGYSTLIVDEPTNHLAPVLVEQLEAALADFTGTLVMVSHDRALREWFDRCASSAESRGVAGAGTGMQDGESAPGRCRRGELFAKGSLRLCPATDGNTASSVRETTVEHHGSVAGRKDLSVITKNLFLQGIFPFDGVGLEKPVPIHSELVALTSRTASSTRRSTSAAATPAPN